MPQINFVWNDSESRLQTYQLSLLDTDLGQKANIGRDQQRCELWLAHNTVSRVHAEVSFKAEWQRFYLRNLAANNPIRVDGGLLVDGEVALYEGSMIQLGQLLLQVSDVVVTGASAPAPNQHPNNVIPGPPDRSVPPVPLVHSHEPSQTTPPSAQVQNAQVQNAQAQSAQAQSAQAQNAAPQNAAPKLLCPKCQTLQVLSLRNSNCPVCGHFLADASSRYFF